jgi:hypothetical protein
MENKLVILCIPWRWNCKLQIIYRILHNRELSTDQGIYPSNSLIMLSSLSPYEKVLEVAASATFQARSLTCISGSFPPSQMVGNVCLINLKYDGITSQIFQF